MKKKRLHVCVCGFGLSQYFYFTDKPTGQNIAIEARFSFTTGVVVQVILFLFL
jgi:hypothetical protein